MNYLLKSKPKGNINPRFVAIGIFSLVLVLIIFIFPGFSRRFVTTVSKPFWALGNSTEVTFLKIKNYFIFKSSLIDNVASLEEELSLLRTVKTDYAVLLKENQELKDELGRRGKKNRIISSILSKPPQSPYDTLILDAGSSLGVSVGNKVYVGENVLLGVVSSVSPSTSVVEMFSRGNKEQAGISSRTGASFTLVGRGGSNLKIEVPKDTDIQWGDIFLYPGLSSSVIGSVYYIDSNSQSSFKTAYLRLPENALQTKTVFIEI